MCLYIHKVLNMCILPVCVYFYENNEQLYTCAILDNYSKDIFIKESLINELNISVIATEIAVRKLYGKKTSKTKAIKGLKVSKLDKKCWIDLPKCYSREGLPIDSEKIVTPDKIRK